jgi:branched-subunit amino acid aminotransferase/4-amino-4-deoxychorismate lyase
MDELGNVNEASTANVIAYFEGMGLVSPPVESILPGVSLAAVERLAGKVGYNFTYDTLAAEDLTRADEILLTSTPFCVLPVSQLGARSFVRRDCFHRIMKAWSDQVGFDIQAQAKRFAS